MNRRRLNYAVNTAIRFGPLKLRNDYSCEYKYINITSRKI